MKIKKLLYIYEQEFCTNKNNKKEFKLKQKVRDPCHYTGKNRGAAHSICNLRFMIKQLARELKGNFDCLGENIEKYFFFSVPIKKEHANGKTSIYKLKFIDSYRFIEDSLSNLVDNLSRIDNKEPKDKFMDTMRSMVGSLSLSTNKISEIDKKSCELIKKNKKINL